MGLLFRNDLHDEFGLMPLAYAPWGGAEFGEVRAVAAAVGDGDDAAFCDAWVAAGDRAAAEGESALAAGHVASARAAILRAACFYASSYRPLFGFPVDPRLLAAYRRQIAAFDRGLGLGDHPVASTPIPFGGAAMPAYLIPAEGRETEVRPLLILTNGYDATVTDMYFASAVAAARRGYHVLAFDGPGQGGMLYEQGMPMRTDWETVVAAAVDFALAQPIVDPDRIALSGWSLGGHLALRAAAGEPRLAAVIADPGLWGIAGPLRAMATHMGMSAQDVDAILGGDAVLAPRIGEALVGRSRRMRWSIVQRAFWVHGVSDFPSYFRAISAFTLDGRADAIRCPALICAAESDPLSGSAQQVIDALTCPKTLLRFTAAEGAGDHCEMGARSLLNRRILDWLDQTLA
ncbi:alpha/beta fold hydrolase [Amaricoccus sp.]|uniref:alpha/beta hydrolase family protein n=1 Tax=Amaricoccus sp. TaxID=1872485 RepID=UPI0025BAE976|nr:alpha/beta fold hydrolase [Amaricoccus sp.]